MPLIKQHRTDRGFVRGDFFDVNGEKCSIQESSAMDDHGLLWLGQNNGTHHRGECLSRMHLNRRHAIALITLLKKFVKTGRLEER